MKKITYLASTFILMSMQTLGWFTKYSIELMLFGIGMVIILGVNEICERLDKKS